MKIGIRTPSVKKSIKARTTGKLKRSIKSSINPLYGKKGMGYINDPKKAIYNKVYNKTTVSAKDVMKNDTDNIFNNEPSENNTEDIGFFGCLGALFQLIVGLIQIAFYLGILIFTIWFLIQIF